MMEDNMREIMCVCIYVYIYTHMYRELYNTYNIKIYLKYVYIYDWVPSLQSITWHNNVNKL